MSGSIPSLNIYSPGVGVYPSAWANTLVQGGCMLAHLRVFSGIGGMTVYMVGYTSTNDGGQGSFVWNSSGSGTDDDGVTVIVPFGAQQGFWERCDPTVAVAQISAAMAPVVSSATLALGLETLLSGGPLADTFVGSGSPALIWLNEQVTGTSNTEPEIAAQFSVSSNAGLANTNTAYKIGITASALGGPQSASVYGANFITQGYGGTYLVTGVESDVNNIGADSVSLGGPSAVYGFVGVAAGNFKSTAGLWITSAGGGTAGWETGVAVSNAQAASYFENSSAAAGVQLAGQHVNGIDMRDGTFTQTLALPNNVAMQQNDTGGTLRNIAYVTNNNQMQLGDPQIVIKSAQSILPIVNNTYQLGTSSFLWTALWASNGTIQPSDPTLKTEIRPLPQAMTLVAAINPIRFKWVDGGDGAPGKRQHWGWNAEEVRDAFAGIGEDFGGYVLSADGTHHLRPDQLIPVLWKAVQELVADFATYKAAHP